MAKKQGKKKSENLFDKEPEAIIIDERVIQMACPNGHPKYRYKTTLDDKALDNHQCIFCGAKPKRTVMRSARKEEADRRKAERAARLQKVA